MSSTQTERRIFLLSFDEGGVHILSALLILQEITHLLREAKALDERPRPCDVFDLAGGTGLGGIIAIMLFRLQMSVDDTIAAYISLVKSVFSKKTKWGFQDATFKASLFEEAFLKIIQCQLNIGTGEARKVLMLNDEGPKCFVCATPARQAALPILFRSWSTSRNPTYNCTIIEAARATSAVLFKSIEIGEPNLKVTYVGGSPASINPVKFVLDEAQTTFPSRPTPCVLSLGPGLIDIVESKKSPLVLQKNSIKHIGRAGEEASEEIANQFLQEGLFFRFNVDRGIQMTSLTDWKRLGDVKAHTMHYMAQKGVGIRLDRLVALISGEGASSKPPPTYLASSDHQALEKLKELVVAGAYEPSGDLAEVVPGTHNSKIATIMEWIEADDRTRPFCVVFGPAGSGKTSLLWYIVRTCTDKGYDTARFFFRRGMAERNSAAHLVTTIAFQIALSIPELQPYIAKAIALDSTILSGSPRRCIDNLLVQPMRQLWSDYPSFIVCPRVILIDALDECGTPDILFQLISTLSSALLSNPLPYFCVFSSRPEAHIVKAFSSDPTQHLISRQIDIGMDFDAMADIRIFFRFRMGEIRHRHPFRELIPANWPSESDLNTLIRKSAGHFIYAATAMKYIDSPIHNPHDRLKDLLGFSSTKPGASPYAELDILYHNLLSSIDNSAALREILGIHLLLSSSQSWIPETLKYGDSDFFKRHFDSLDADTVLAPLAAVLRYQNRTITFYHQSFVDFLFDKAGSLGFSIDLTRWQEWVVGQLVRHFYEGNSIESEDFEYLIKAKPVALPQAIISGCRLTTNPRLYVGSFDVRPFVTYMFFSQLGLIVAPAQEYVNLNTIIQPGDDVVPLSVLMKLGPSDLSNSFLLFEFCRMCAAMKNSMLIKESATFITPSRLSDCMTYLADFLDDWKGSEVNTFLQRDYITATLRCLWYLHTPSRDIRSSLKQQLSSLLLIPQDLGITKYLDIDTNNLSRGALQALPKLLQRLPKGPPDDNLVRAFKEPFDNELTSRTPRLSRQAQSAIHNYIGQHGKAQAQYAIISEDIHSREDEPAPDFHAFLISKERLEPLWLS